MCQQNIYQGWSGGIGDLKTTTFQSEIFPHFVYWYKMIGKIYALKIDPPQIYNTKN